MKTPSDKPVRRGRPPKVMAHTVDRLAALTAREKAYAVKARARHRYTFDMPLDMYEALLNQCEVWDQPLPDVVRACIKKGLETIQRFGGNERNPYIHGRLSPLAQADIDPTGLDWPPTGPSFVPTPNWDLIPHSVPSLEPAPPPMRFAGPPKPPAGLMPNGHTPLVTDTPVSAPPRFPDEEESDS